MVSVSADMADFKQGDRVAVLHQKLGGWFYDGSVEEATGDTLKLKFNQHERNYWTIWTIPRDESGEVVRDIRAVFYRGSFARHHGKLGKVTMNCNSDHEVRLMFLDGSESSLVKVDDLVDATPAEYDKAQSDICNAAKVIVSVTNLAGSAMLEPTEMQPSTTIAEIKRLIVLRSSHCTPFRVHLHHGSAELSDLSTLEQFQEDGSAELSGVCAKLSITDDDRTKCLRQLEARLLLNRDFERLFMMFDEASRADQELVGFAVSCDGLLLRHAHTALCSNRHIALKAVTSNGQALEFVSSALKKDKEVVLTAARQNCKAMAFANAALRADAKLILEAGGPVKRWNPEVLQYVSQQIWADTNFVKQVARRNKSLLQQASIGQYGVPSDLGAEKHLALLVIRQSPEQLCHAAETMRRDKDVVLAAVRKNGETLRHAHEELKKDREVVIEAVRQNPQALRHAHTSLQMTGAGGHAAALKKLLG